MRTQLSLFLTVHAQNGFVQSKNVAVYIVGHVAHKSSLTSDTTLLSSLFWRQFDLRLQDTEVTLEPCELIQDELIRELIIKSPTKSCMLDPIPTSITKQCLNDLVSLIRLLLMPLFLQV